MKEITKRFGIIFPASLLVGIAALGIQSCSVAPEPKPNILLIVCDDLNDAVTGFGGHPQAHTPNLDRLASQGVRFTNAQTNAPVCGPSRASFLTGLYPHSTGYFGYNFNRDHWRSNPDLSRAVTFLQYFRENGYEVLGTGKIFHNNQEDWSVWDEFGYKPSWGPWPWDGTPDDAYFHGHLGESSNSALHPDFAEHFNKTDMFGPLSNVPDVPADPQNNIPGYKGWRLYYEPFRYVDGDDRDLIPDELNAKWVAEKLSEPRDHPFMMCVGMNRPHSPMFAPQKYFDMFPLENVQLTKINDQDLEDCSDALVKPPGEASLFGLRRYARFMETGGEDMLKRWTQAYLANVAFVDDQIGKVLEALEKSPHAENTYIFFISDHGYHMGEKLYLFKNSVWEESCRIPFIAAGPGVSQAAECDQPISLVDLFPTFIDLCDIRDNYEFHANQQKLDGFSIRPLIEDPAEGKWEGPQDAALSVVASRDRLALGEPGKVKRQHYSMRTTHYRYVLCNTGEEELYDHTNDPYEWTNLAGDPQYENVLEELNLQLIKILDQSDQPEK